MSVEELNVSIVAPSTIHVGPIVTGGCNETISIVIPLSAQLVEMFGGGESNSGKVVPPRPTTVKDSGCPVPTCSKFGRPFTRTHDLKRHVARHQVKKDFDSSVLQKFLGNGFEKKQQQFLSCDVCHKKYLNVNKLKAHLAIHEKKILNVCVLCDKSFECPEELEMHSREHSRLIMEDELLLTSYATKDDNDDFSLDELLLLNTMEKNKKPNSNNKGNNKKPSVGGRIHCGYCSKIFKTKWTLHSHLAAHEGRFQFHCDVCGKRFVRKCHYDGHTRSHNQDRPFNCEICGKTFKELKHRKEHSKRKHPAAENN